ncbi:MAG: type II toxin-antitoxin system HicB family antitoxin [Thermoanaerobacteraceae bacterium]|nr:type II toxin-antitoxin system HicB family antitoxin [Thermoanaerobacteraceae bacterium]
MNKSLDYYLQLPYKVIFHPAEEGGYVAEIAELPGCISQGETIEETWQMIQDAKRSWLETALEEGIPVPEPSGEGYSGRLVIRMPESLHKLLAEQARKERVSLNQYIVQRLARSFGR